MKFTVKSLKYFMFILAFSLFVTYFNLKLKKSMGLDEASFGDTDFMYSMALDVGVFYFGKIMYYLIKFPDLL